VADGPQDQSPAQRAHEVGEKGDGERRKEPPEPDMDQRLRDLAQGRAVEKVGEQHNREHEAGGDLEQMAGFSSAHLAQSSIGGR